MSQRRPPADAGYAVFVRTIITSSATSPGPAATPRPVRAGARVPAPYGSGRSSAARTVIARAAAAFANAFTVEELVAAVREQRPSTGVATVYRAVAAMRASGFLEQVGERDGTALLAHCAHEEHHHHVVCTGCGATMATKCPLGDDLAGAAVAAGFTVTGHDVHIYGLCPKCSGRPPARGA